MKKTILISILAILLIASFVAIQPNEELITKEQQVNFLALRPLTTRPPTSIYTKIDIIDIYNKYIDADTLRINLKPLANYYDSEGNFRYCPSGRMVCERAGLECIGLEHKYNDRDWGFIDEPVLNRHPCDWENVSLTTDSTTAVVNFPYGKYYDGINRKWPDFQINTSRGATYYNFTIVNATENDVTVKIYLRYAPDRRPETQTIPKGEYRIFTTKGDIYFHIRNIDLPNNKVSVLIVQEGSTVYRAVCKKPGTPTIKPSNTLSKEELNFKDLIHKDDFLYSSYKIK